MKIMKSFAAVAVVVFWELATGAQAAAAKPLAAGEPVPAFTYQLTDGHRLSSNKLRGHPYLLWAVASWCSSCETGSRVVASHVALLRRHGVRIVEMQLANDLGAPGPGIQSFQKDIGTAANSPGWYWGILTSAQTAALDPQGTPDIYYLVNAKGVIVAIDSSPAATWDTIARFAAANSRASST